MFSLPADTISNIISYAGQFFNDIKIYIILAIGVSLGLFIIHFLVGLISSQDELNRIESELDDIDDE